MKTLTFYSNTKYAGGRSHRNVNTLELVEGKDIIEASEMYGYNVYLSEGESFEKGIKNWNGNEVMDAEEYADFVNTGVGRLDFGDTVFVSCKLEAIGLQEFKILPEPLKLEYINIWYQNVTEEMLEHVDPVEAYEYMETEWKMVEREISEINQEA